MVLFFADLACCDLELVQDEFVFVLYHEEVLGVVRIVLKHADQLVSRYLIEDAIIRTLDIKVKFILKQKVKRGNLIIIRLDLKMLHNPAILRGNPMIIRITKAALIKNNNINIITFLINDLIRMG